jgi:hypothetical protein
MASTSQPTHYATSHVEAFFVTIQKNLVAFGQKNNEKKNIGKI